MSNDDIFEMFSQMSGYQFSEWKLSYLKAKEKVDCNCPHKFDRAYCDGACDVPDSFLKGN